ncbi:hypothetical protein FMEAI12_2700006 [Parafrankia sp. Ea1.12]|nr:hypothetical protein FMEAI12_2700006 [Parafrankia sp. Ea1.12]
MAGSGSSGRGVGPPAVEADEVDRGRGEDVGEMVLGQAVVAGVADTGGGGGLVHGSLDAGPEVVALLPRVGGLLGAEPFKQFVLVAGTQGELAGRGRRGGAAGAQRAGQAVHPAEIDLQDGFPSGLLGSPGAAGGAVRAGGLLSVPVDGEVGQVEGAGGAGLPGGVHSERADQFDAMLGRAGQEQLGGGVAGVDGVFGGQQTTAGEVGVHDRGRLLVGDGGGGGLHVGDHVWGVVVAGLGEVDLVADPARPVFDPVACVKVIGRGQPASARREVLVLPPDHLRPGAVVLLDPRDAQDVDRGDLAQPGRRVGSADRREQGEPVPADHDGQLGAARRRPRQPVGLHPRRIATVPTGLDDPGQPARGRRGQRLKRPTHRLTDELEPVERAHRGQHMGGIGAGPPARAQQPEVRQPREQQVQNLLLQTMFHEPDPEPAQHGEVETRVVETEAKRVLPVDPPPDLLRGLPVSEVLGELQHRDQRQLARRTARPAPGRERRHELLVAEQLPDLVAHPDRQSTPRERRPRDPRGHLGNLRPRLWLQRHRTPHQTDRDIAYRAAIIAHSEERIGQRSPEDRSTGPRLGSVIDVGSRPGGGHPR